DRHHKRAAGVEFRGADGRAGGTAAAVGERARDREAAVAATAADRLRQDADCALALRADAAAGAKRHAHHAGGVAGTALAADRIGDRKSVEAGMLEDRGGRVS